MSAPRCVRVSRSARWRSTSIRPAGGAATTSSTASRTASCRSVTRWSSFNPTFGQGMTMTSLQAGHLQRALQDPGRESGADVREGHREDDVAGVDDERDRRPGAAPGRRDRCRGGTARSGRCSTSSSARPRPIPFWRNGFCAGSAFSTVSTWCRRRDWSAAPSGTTCGCGWPTSAGGLDPDGHAEQLSSARCGDQPDRAVVGGHPRRGAPLQRHRRLSWRAPSPNPRCTAGSAGRRDGSARRPRGRAGRRRRSSTDTANSGAGVW